MAIELVSYAILKDLLGLEGSTIADYPALSVIQSGVVSAIETYLSRTLDQDEYTEIHFAGSVSTRMIPVPAIPVISVSSVTVTESGVDTELASTEYEITSWGIRLGIGVSNCKIVVVYTGGWEDSDIPVAVTRAALLQTAYEFQSKDQVGAEYVSTEGGSVTRPELGLLKEVKRMLDQHKHPLSEF